MKRTIIALIALLLASKAPYAQTAMLVTNPLAEQIMTGSYDPALYTPAIVFNSPDIISRGINAGVSPDSLHAYLEALRSFKNRNTGSDTVSTTRGIGAARRWVYGKFQQFSAQAGGRLIPSYVQFNALICSQRQHRDILAVLPGTDTSNKSMVVIEAHVDSRCAGLCDISCLAEGMEDNGSGTALVLELARVMSRYCFRQTIVFLVVVGEEQGLYGAKAFADYTVQKGIGVKATFNNDVIGGIICGKTSSPPGCPGLNAIDSTHVRLFSSGGFSSPHKGLARFVKLQYKERVKPYAAVPMTIHIMTNEDRSGRGGDHIPFRRDGLTAIRFTSANEQGDADVSDLDYTDRQHTSADILGVDQDNDGVLDAFFVDFDYLARNAVINGVAAAMAAIGPKTPGFSLSDSGRNKLIIQITQQTGYPAYRVALRTATNDWDTVYTFSGPGPYAILLPAKCYIVSTASVDANGVESLFSAEQIASLQEGIKNMEQPAVELLQTKPKFYDEATLITVLIRRPLDYREAFIEINEYATGRVVKRLPIELKGRVAEVVYKYGDHAGGTYIYALVVDGKPLQSRKMVFGF